MVLGGHGIDVFVPVLFRQQKKLTRMYRLSISVIFMSLKEAHWVPKSLLGGVEYREVACHSQDELQRGLQTGSQVATWYNFHRFG